MRIFIAVLLTLLGLACFVVAATNIYNVDRQPWALLGGYALLGASALHLALQLARPRGTRRSSPPAT